MDEEGKFGLEFFVLSDKYLSITLGFSIITIYIYISYFSNWKLLRDFFSGGIKNIMLTCMPNSNLLLTICESISYARTEGDFVKYFFFYIFFNFYF